MLTIWATSILGHHSLHIFPLLDHHSCQHVKDAVALSKHVHAYGRSLPTGYVIGVREANWVRCGRRLKDLHLLPR